ncbi:reverse transcriptase N-terminal domain-containing protein, partial [Acinetobacter towneri]|uniref:reverse transcriptase N-terminal domain-containing protein n=1 Tax=Acinetobacter towneri TaxID=202956 RepID=UPI003F67DC4A
MRLPAHRGTASIGLLYSGHVRGLQARIVKAVQDGRYNKAKALQWLLTHSFSGKALAVKRV